MSKMDDNGNGGEIFPKILVLKIGNSSNWKELKFWLDFKGYTRCSTVSAEGEYAEVGSSILIWQRGDTSPLILDRFGEILERAQVKGKWLSKGSLMILPFCMNQPSAALNHSERV